MPTIGQSPAGASSESMDVMARDLMASGTPLAIQTDLPVPMRVGAAIHGRLLYPVWQKDKLLLPEGTVVHGEVVALVPDRAHRMQSRLRGDFTPFRRPAVRFDELEMAGGIVVPLTTSLADEGAALMRLTPPPPVTGGVFAQRRRMVAQMVRDRIAVVTGPDKRDRAVQFLYTQLPFHPQRISAKTAWTVETAGVTALPERMTDVAPQPVALVAEPKTAADTEQTPAPWVIEAYMKERLSSKESRQGQVIHAVVAKPVFNADKSVAVPEGAMLDGAVTQVRPARWWGRAGVLRFDFRQLQLPDASTAMSVRTAIAGLDAPSGADLALDSEGQVQPKPKDKVVVPLLLLALASRPLDRDHGDGGIGKDAVASNSLGLVGFIVGTAAGWHNVAAGIGFYGTAISIWNRWIKRGAETTFVRDTRVIVQTSPRRSAPLPAPAGSGSMR